MVVKKEDIITRIYFPGAIKTEGFKKGDSVLDVGCATGNFLKLCDNFGLKTYGIDISAKWLEKAKTNTIAKLKYWDLNTHEQPFPGTKFNLITAFDVIEHLDSPSNFVKNAYNQLKPGGKIIITTPNLNSLGRLTMKERWHGYSDKTHKYLFTLESLEYLLLSNGFRITKSFAPFHPLPKFIQLVVNKFGLGGQIWIVARK